MNVTAVTVKFWSRLFWRKHEQLDGQTKASCHVLAARIALRVVCFAGMGATPLYTLGVAYLDENLKTKMSPVYIGEFTLAGTGNVVPPLFDWGGGGILMHVHVLSLWKTPPPSSHCQDGALFKPHHPLLCCEMDEEWWQKNTPTCSVVTNINCSHLCHRLGNWFMRLWCVWSHIVFVWSVNE